MCVKSSLHECTNERRRTCTHIVFYNNLFRISLTDLSPKWKKKNGQIEIKSKFHTVSTGISAWRRLFSSPFSSIIAQLNLSLYSYIDVFFTTENECSTHQTSNKMKCTHVLCQSTRWCGFVNQNVKVKLAENRFSVITFSMRMKIHPFDFMEIFV